MDGQQPVSKNANLIKKVIFGLLIAAAVLIILFIIVTVANSFRQSKISQIATTGEMGYGVASEGIGLAPSVPSPLSDQAVSVQKMIARNETVTPTTASNTQPIEQKVIKNASLDIAVDDVDQTVDKITNETSALSGFVQNSNVSETTTGQKYANIVVRVPVKSFETLISRIKAFAKLVQRENINGQEVTQEYVDLQSNLTHNQAVEAQYLELLKRAQKVEEIIAVREKLDQVQAEIETIKGRLRYLDNQTEMSTISVNISSEVKITLPAEKWQPWEILKNSVKNLIVSLQNFINFIIMLIFALIALIPYVILLLIIYLLSKRIYKKYKKPKQIQ